MLPMYLRVTINAIAQNDPAVAVIFAKLCEFFSNVIRNSDKNK